MEIPLEATFDFEKFNIGNVVETPWGFVFERRIGLYRVSTIRNKDFALLGGLRRAVDKDIVPFTPSGRVKTGDLFDSDEVRSLVQLNREEMKRYAGDDRVKQAYIEAIVSGRGLPPIAEENVPERLYHGGLALKHVGKDWLNMLKAARGGIFGDLTYLSTSRNMSAVHIGEPANERKERNYFEKSGLKIANQALLLTVNGNVLQRLRDVYIDPESLSPDNADEWGKNFLVTAGIPSQAIEQVELFEFVEF